MTDDRRAALTAMIAQEPQRLRRRSISLGVPLDDADDVAQQAVLQAWRAVSRLDGADPGTMCSWLDVIARNMAIDFARRRQRTAALSLDDEAVATASVAETVEIRTFLDGALAALKELPSGLSEPLLLSAVDGLSTAQVADRLGITPDAARQRISRARQALRRCRRSGMGAG